MRCRAIRMKLSKSTKKKHANYCGKNAFVEEFKPKVCLRVCVYTADGGERGDVD